MRGGGGSACKDHSTSFEPDEVEVKEVDTEFERTSSFDLKIPKLELREKVETKNPHIEKGQR